MLRWSIHRAVFFGLVVLGLALRSRSARATSPSLSPSPDEAASKREGAYEDAWTWYQGQKPERAPPPPRPSFHADRIDVGGLVVPQLTLPILVTDPYRTDHAGAPGARAASVGYGLEWRLGYAFGGLSIEGIGGFGRVSRGDLVLDAARSVPLALERAWFGGQLARRSRRAGSSIRSSVPEAPPSTGRSTPSSVLPARPRGRTRS
jgi:hypothetical protein